jgi:hypothetical protein
MHVKLIDKIVFKRDIRRKKGYVDLCLYYMNTARSNNFLGVLGKIAKYE